MGAGGATGGGPAAWLAPPSSPTWARCWSAGEARWIATALASPCGSGGRGSRARRTGARRRRPPTMPRAPPRRASTAPPATPACDCPRPPARPRARPYDRPLDPCRPATAARPRARPPRLAGERPQLLLTGRVRPLRLPLLRRARPPAAADARAPRRRRARRGPAQRRRSRRAPARAARGPGLPPPLDPGAGGRDGCSGAGGAAPAARSGRGRRAGRARAALCRQRAVCPLGPRDADPARGALRLPALRRSRAATGRRRDRRARP